MDWTHAIVASIGHNQVLAYVTVGYLGLKRVPGLIAAFRVAFARKKDEAERAREALETIEPRWYWIWQKRG